jgi:hypothetical protein
MDLGTHGHVDAVVANHLAFTDMTLLVLARLSVCVSPARGAG